MANEEIAYKVSVETGDGAKSLSDLKREFKEAQKSLSGLQQGTKEYTEALKKLGGARDDIKRLNEEINVFAGGEGQLKAVGNAVSGLASGFSAAQGAMSLMGSDSEDLQKTLVKLQAVMAFQQGIQGLEGIGDAFQDLWKVIRANPLGAILAGLAALVAVGVLLYQSMDKSSASTKELNKQLEKQKAATETLSRTIGREIDILTAQGESQEKIIKKKRELINAQIAEIETSIKLHQSKLRDIQDNDGIWEGMLRIQEAGLRKLGFDKEANAVANAIQAEKQSRMKEDIEAIKKEKEDLLDLKNTIKVLDAEEVNIKKEQSKKFKEEYDKRLADEIDFHNKSFAQFLKDAELKKALREKEAAEIEKINKTAEDKIASNMAKMEADRMAQAELNLIRQQYDLQSQIDFLNVQRDIELEHFEGTELEKALIIERYDKQVKDAKEASINSQIDAYQQLGQATMQIADLVFAHQMKQAEGNASKQRQIAQRQFKVNKALGIVNATIDGIQAVQKALNNPYPLNIILAAASGIAAAANIAKISSTKFDGGGASGGGGGVGDVPSPPNIAPPSQGSTALNADGTVKNNNTSTPTIKAVVVETDITKTQNKVSTIESNSRL